MARKSKSIVRDVIPSPDCDAGYASSAHADFEVVEEFLTN
jgi:hypothetical protein